MERRDFLKTCMLSIGSLSVSGCSLLERSVVSQSTPRARPSIILVFIDDMGWGDLSCFGNQDAQTPNIDRLATEGIAFESFYVNSPICSPSRVAISTGTYPQRWKITSYLAFRKQNQERDMANWLDPEAPMLARSLKQAGYATGHFGKWHMGGQRDVTEAPQIAEYGFDESLTNFEGLGPKLLPLTMQPNGETGKLWADAERLGGPVTWMERSRITGGFVKSAMTFMDKAQKEDKPFYVNIWPDDVHSPFWPPVDKWGDGSKRRLYLSVLEEMDTQLGALFEYVRNSKALRRNTLILICSDNGCEKDAGQAGPLKGYKTHLYEGGIRSSLVVWGPGLMAEDNVGKRNNESIFSAIDLVPSLLRLAGTEGPKNAQYDGEDMLDVILGKSQASRKAPIFFSRPPDRKNFFGFTNLPDLAVIDGQWKLLCDYDGGRPELYDISSDPAESNNLSDAQPEVTKKLTKKVVNWYLSMPDKNI